MGPFCRNAFSSLFFYMFFAKVFFFSSSATCFPQGNPTDKNKAVCKHICVVGSHKNFFFSSLTHEGKGRRWELANTL